jgi:hypothetical protein
VALQQAQQPSLGEAGDTATAAAAGAGGASGPRTLLAFALPQLDVPAALQRVLDSCATPARKRKFKLLPFLPGAGGDQGPRITDD